jgi:hypothetical protein
MLLECSRIFLVVRDLAEHWSTDKGCSVDPENPRKRGIESVGYSGRGAPVKNTLPAALLYELLAVLAGGAYWSSVLGSGKPSLV